MRRVHPAESFSRGSPRSTLFRVSRNVACVLFLFFSATTLRSDDSRPQYLEAPLLSDEDAETFLFSIPAPRGLIVDRHGEPLAQNRIIQRAALRLDQWDRNSPEKAIRAALMTIQLFPYPAFVSTVPTESTLLFHWQHRRSLPFVFTRGLDPGPAEQVSQSALFEPALCLQTEYQRDYPRGHSACHLVGYVARTILHPAGPVQAEEPLWPEVHGTAGLEKAFDQTLRGTNGLVNHFYDDYGQVRREQLIRAPVPGKTLVLSLDLRMQDLAEQILQSSGRFGAFVVMESQTGEVLALASYPTFDVGKFIPAISSSDFESIRSTPGNPFFARSFAGQYPPGSIFKPVIALAAMKEGPVKDTRFRYHCSSSLDVSGRVFHNWSARDGGYLNVCEALCQSNNVWFYQAGIATGAAALLESARGFGFGKAPLLPLDGAAAGTLPRALQGERAVANFSIGQGDLLVSPLQMTTAYCGLANGRFVPHPRLLLQIQSPPPSITVLDAPPSLPPLPLPFESRQILAIRQGLWESVNSVHGTGKAARLTHPKVLGKTGTAQWTPKDGEDRWVGWFSGFVDSTNPQLVFTVMCESLPGEPISGGQIAAPLAAQFLETVYGDPNQYRLAEFRAPSANSQ